MRTHRILSLSMLLASCAPMRITMTCHTGDNHAVLHVSSDVMPGVTEFTASPIVPEAKSLYCRFDMRKRPTP